MPPKKGKKGKGKGKKKGKGKGEKKGAAPPAAALTEDILTESSKQFYIVQIKDLEERLNRYQAKCDKLELLKMDLEKKLQQQLEDQEQMIVFLKRKAKDQAERFMDLEEKLQHAQQTKLELQEKMEAQLAQLKEESQRALDQAVMENKILQGQLDSLEAFKQNKDKMEKEMAEKAAEIVRLKEQHKETLYQLEKKAVLDKDRMMKEMVVKVNCVAAEFRKVSDIQMAETTKRAIRENVSINQQLSKMSDRTVELLKENQQLKNGEKDLKRQLSILEASNTVITKKNLSCLKVMKMLTSKAGEQETWNAQLEERVVHCTTLEQEADLAQRETDDRKKEVGFLKGHVAHLEYQRYQVKMEMEKATAEIIRLQTIIKNTSVVLQTTLQGGVSQPKKMEHCLPVLLQILEESKPDLSQFKYQPGSFGIVPPPPGYSKHTNYGGGPRTAQSLSDTPPLQLPPLVGTQASAP